jgi:integrase
MILVSCMSNPSVTFSQQSELWLDLLRTRKRKPVSPATLHAYSSYVRRLTPIIGETKLADINDGAVRQLVQELDKQKLNAKTINELVAVVKMVVSSQVDEETGAAIFKREWSATYIDCPTVRKQKQPCVTAKDVEHCITEATSDQEALLYALLAGTGMRIAEVLSVHVDGSDNQTSWDHASGAIAIRSSLYNGTEIQRVKTVAARRTVDLDPSLNDLVTRFVELNGIQPGGYLFQTRRRRAMHVNTVRNRLAARGIPGFHSFRRFRITRLREYAVPEDILRFWVGHSGQSITDRYSKLGECDDLRREWATRAELGFALPELCKRGDPPPSCRDEVKRDGAHLLAEPAERALEVAAYHATDDDLPIDLFESPTETLAEVAASLVIPSADTCIPNRSGPHIRSRNAVRFVGPERPRSLLAFGRIVLEKLQHALLGLLFVALLGIRRVLDRRLAAPNKRFVFCICHADRQNENVAWMLGREGCGVFVKGAPASPSAVPAPASAPRSTAPPETIGIRVGSRVNQFLALYVIGYDQVRRLSGGNGSQSLRNQLGDDVRLQPLCVEGRAGILGILPGESLVARERRSVAPIDLHGLRIERKREKN